MFIEDYYFLALYYVYLFDLMNLRMRISIVDLIFILQKLDRFGEKAVQTNYIIETNCSVPNKIRL